MRVYVATPAYGAMDPCAAHSFAMGIAGLVAQGHSVRWDLEMRDSNQARARSVLLHRFLRSEFDRLLCVDSDSVFTPEDLTALLAVEEDVVSAYYVRKMFPLDGVGEPDQATRGALLEMRCIGFGLVSFSRACASKLMESSTRSFIPSSGASAGERVPETFATDIVDDEWVTVDWNFSARWRELGGRLWVHTGIRIGHVGPHVFGGDS